MIKEIIACLSMCPALQGKVITGEYLPDEENTLSVSGVSCAPVVEKYVDGESLKQYMFFIYARKRGLIEEGTDVLELLSSVGCWLETEGEQHFSSGEAEAQGFTAVSSPELIKREYGSDCYGIKCRLLYYQKRM